MAPRGHSRRFPLLLWGLYAFALLDAVRGFGYDSAMEWLRLYAAPIRSRKERSHGRAAVVGLTNNVAIRLSSSKSEELTTG